MERLLVVVLSLLSSRHQAKLRRGNMPVKDKGEEASEGKEDSSDT